MQYGYLSIDLLVVSDICVASESAGILLQCMHGNSEVFKSLWQTAWNSHTKLLDRNSIIRWPQTSSMLSLSHQVSEGTFPISHLRAVNSVASCYAAQQYSFRKTVLHLCVPVKRILICPDLLKVLIIKQKPIAVFSFPSFLLMFSVHLDLMALVH